MPGTWVPALTRGLGGRFQLVITGRGFGGARVDVTNFRGAPAQLGDYADSDPFGDATFTVTFPQISPLDDFDSPELGSWLAYYSDVDLWWVPAIPSDPALYPTARAVTNPLTGQPDAITPTTVAVTSGGHTTYHDGRVKLWEGFIADIEATEDGSAPQIAVQCQGALFQLDRYRAKPFYPAQPWAYEALMADAFSHARRPSLRTQELRVTWPAGWARKYPSYKNPTIAQQILTPLGRAGGRWSGYASRETGSWNPSLTGFVQDMLGVMITDDKSGVVEGNQWTVNQVRQQPASHGARAIPVLSVRDRYRAPDFSVWVGTPGVTVQLAGDGTQGENVIYGDGVGLDGTTWHNDVINARGSRTDYLPLAAARFAYPEHQWYQNAWAPRGTKLNHYAAPMPLEAYTKFGPGFDQTAAVSSAKQMLARDQQPGWSGTVTLAVDPSAVLTRWQIHAGMTVRLRGFAGTGAAGMSFHIASVSHSPANGTVQLTVDTRYRDLLTVEEAVARTRDPLTPLKMLQVGKASMIIEDMQAPWSYARGSGFIPTRSKDGVFTRPAADPFPYRDWLRRHPPSSHPHWYVGPVYADAPNPTNRWSGPQPVLVSAKGTVIRTELIAVNHLGEIMPVPFHASFYYVQAQPTAMPLDEHGHSAYINNAFEKVDPLTGFHTPGTITGDPSMIIGWGNRSGGVFRRAGFWPGTEVQGAPPSGIMVDDGPWSYDMTSYRTYFGGYYNPKLFSITDITIFLELYCEHPSPVWFIGRLFHQNPGAS